MKITMKSKIQHARMALVLALPLSLLVAGCKDKTNEASESPPLSNRTNAAVADADNSARNVRDRNDATVTPLDQGNTPADREMTQQIRKALVMDTSGYSATAKNIKIITANGKVTLRGPVKSESEKMGIVALAKSIAGEGNLEDQLEVKANP
jgi:hyperosmotically inducible protein